MSQATPPAPVRQSFEFQSELRTIRIEYAFTAPDLIGTETIPHPDNMTHAEKRELAFRHVSEFYPAFLRTVATLTGITLHPIFELSDDTAALAPPIAPANRQ